MPRRFGRRVDDTGLDAGRLRPACGVTGITRFMRFAAATAHPGQPLDEPRDHAPAEGGKAFDYRPGVSPGRMPGARSGVASRLSTMPAAHSPKVAVTVTSEPKP